MLVFVTLLAKDIGLIINLWSFVIKKNMASKLSAISEHSTQIVKRPTKLDPNQPTMSLLLFLM